MKKRFESYITTVCKECDTKLGIKETKDPRMDGKISHTICEKCLSEDPEKFGLTAQEADNIIMKGGIR